LKAVAHLRDRFGVDPILRVLGVAPSTFYGWLDRQRHPSDRQRADAVVLAEIVAIHERSGGTYGSPRVHATLRRRGVHVSRKRVERLMRDAGLQGAFLRKKWRTSSTRQNPAATPAPRRARPDRPGPSGSCGSDAAGRTHTAHTHALTTPPSPPRSPQKTW
jgi:putative transposase